MSKVASYRPSVEWFSHISSLRFVSEREVEVHFVTPLFHALGYSDDQEAIGFRFDMWEGVKPKKVEADCVYFADDNHVNDGGQPLVLVECKSPSHEIISAVGQVRSYCYWIKPVYYLITNGDEIQAYLYQGGAISDVLLFSTTRSALTDTFDLVHSYLNPKAVQAAGREREKRLSGV